MVPCIKLKTTAPSINNHGTLLIRSLISSEKEDFFEAGFIILSLVPAKVITILIAVIIAKIAIEN